MFADQCELWLRRALATSCIVLLLTAIIYFAQLRSFRVFVNGGIPTRELTALYKIWMMTDSMVPSPEGTHFSIAIAGEGDDEIPRRPTSMAEIVICTGRNKLAIGRVQRECKTRKKGWECTYRGAPVVLFPFWLLLGVPGIVVLMLVVTILLRRHVLAQDRDGSSCQRCGYLLFGLTSDRCPECGTPFRGIGANEVSGHNKKITCQEDEEGKCQDEC